MEGYGGLGSRASSVEPDDHLWREARYALPTSEGGNVEPGIRAGMLTQNRMPLMIHPRRDYLIDKNPPKSVS